MACEDLFDNPRLPQVRVLGQVLGEAEYRERTCGGAEKTLVRRDEGEALETERPKKKQIRWKPEHYAWVRENYPTHSVTQLSLEFERKFGLRVSPSAIGFKLWQHKIRKTAGESK